MIKKIVNINDINITDDFKATMPGTKKFHSKYCNFKRRNKLDDIVLDKQGNLVDGYCSYLLAKAFDIGEIEVVVRTDGDTEETKQYIHRLQSYS